MHQIVGDDHLVVAVRRVKLLAYQGIPRCDGQRLAGRRTGGRGDADPSADECAQHGEESLVLILDGRGVGAVGVDVRIFVEQVGARHPHVVEHNAPVVDSGEAAFVSAVAGGDAGQIIARRVPDGYHEAMHSPAGCLFARPAGDELSENRGHGGVLRGATNVVLTCQRALRVQNEVAGLVVVGGDGLQGLNVGTMAGLGHAETSEYVQIDQRYYVLLVMSCGAEVFDGTAEQAPLHAGLDHE